MFFNVFKYFLFFLWYVCTVVKSFIFDRQHSKKRQHFPKLWNLLGFIAPDFHQINIEDSGFGRFKLNNIR